MAVSRLPVTQTGAETFTPTPRRPNLIWQGRGRRKVADAVPAQTLEVVRPVHNAAVGHGAASPGLWQGQEGAPQNRLIWTNDNLVALTSLVHGDDEHPPLAGEVDLIYIDPPFAVQSNFNINVEIENGVADEKLPSLIEQLAYEDTWQNGLDSYLSMMRDRLELLKQLLKPTGSIYVHCDWHAAHYLKVLMDEVFGYENFINEIVWKRTGTHGTSRSFGVVHDTLLFYSSSDSYTFHPPLTPLDDDYIKSHYTQQDSNGRRYQLISAHGAGQGPARRFGGKEISPPPGRHWAYSQEAIDRLLAEGIIVFTGGGMPRVKRYADEAAMPTPTIWQDISVINSQAIERVDFPTQKPLALLQRIIAASSNPGDLVLDAFVGSGTTAVAAETMQDESGKPAPRRWIAVDCGKFAVHITRKRMIEAQARPFSVESVGFYSRADTWQSVLAKRPSARVYRDALVEIYGGEAIEGFTYLHGRKGTHWVHVGPLDAPIAEAQLADILKEAATTDLRDVDVLSADIPVDWNPNAQEYQYGVRVYPKVIPQAAVEAVRDRLKRRKRRDDTLEPSPDIHFFSPPDVEITVAPQPGGATVRLHRLTIDLDDCLSTQDERKRAQIKASIKDWTSLVDYWAVDWDWHDGKPFENQWQDFRTRKKKDLLLHATHTYQERGEKRIAVKVTDIFGNDGLKVIRVTV